MQFESALIRNCYLCINYSKLNIVVIIRIPTATEINYCNRIGYLHRNYKYNLKTDRNHYYNIDIIDYVPGIGNRFTPRCTAKPVSDILLRELIKR